MFKKILIANRGEIAIRIMRTCREMGIDTVMVYSTVDRHALHVQMASESICIGGPQAKDSYLNMQNILSAALLTGCDAIHPGYGFLSERAEFAELCEEAGLQFIGPRSETIQGLGDKAKAKAIMKAAGIPIIPGSEGLVADAKCASKLASEIGYPVLLKASCGGGGRGMRRVNQEAEMESAFAEAQKEAQTCFGNGDLYLEKLILRPRHIEFQILADSHGQVIHLGDRDCSIQRKRQKMVEETPSPFLSDCLREEIGQMAVLAAQSASYLGAGTVEFILDKSGNYYFMEVNTRIQVEHPITEMVSGIDLIKEQIRIASGAKLPFTQAEVKLQGHAIECRINAENTRRNFQPSPGVIQHFSLPGGFSVRVDAAIYPGCEISPWYDSMIAKIIVHAPNRREAVRRMRRCLEEVMIGGIECNSSLLYVLLYENEFIRGDYHTEFLEERLPSLLEYLDISEKTPQTANTTENIKDEE